MKKPNKLITLKLLFILLEILLKSIFVLKKNKINHPQHKSQMGDVITSKLYKIYIYINSIIV